MAHVLGEITYDTVKIVLDHAIQHEKTPLVLCSPGGEAGAGKACSSIIEFFRVPIIVVGEAHSAALTMVAASPMVYALPDSTFLLHEPYMSGDVAAGRHDDLSVLGTSLRLYFNWTCALLGRRTSKPASWWRSSGRGAGRELSADFALEIGLLDGVIPQSDSESSHSILKALKAFQNAPVADEDGAYDSDDVG